MWKVFTALVEDPEKAKKIKGAIPNNVIKVELGDKKGKKDKKDEKATGKKSTRN